jgi:dephospho-CoA kinase
MIKVGITGGIGSGKSTVCKVFKGLGIPVFEADAVAKQIMTSDPQIQKLLIEAFGIAVYLPDGSIDRKYLAGLVFNNESLLSELNSIVHPAVLNEFDEWCETKQTAYILHEAAILFESGFYKMMDKIIAVVTSEEERIQRVIKRDGATIELVRQRIQNQMSDADRIKLADFVISNNDDELIIPQILIIDKKIRAYG